MSKQTLYTNNRDAYRETIGNAWQKHLQNMPLSTVEQQLVNVIAMHPDIQQLLSQAEQLKHQEFSLEDNPFLHVSLHVTLREQIRLDKPAGIRHVYEKLRVRYLTETDQDPLAIEHIMLPCLAEVLWYAQAKGVLPDEKSYLALLNQL